MRREGLVVDLLMEGVGGGQFLGQIVGIKSPQGRSAVRMGGVHFLMDQIHTHMGIIFRYLDLLKEVKMLRKQGLGK